MKKYAYLFGALTLMLLLSFPVAAQEPVTLENGDPWVRVEFGVLSTDGCDVPPEFIDNSNGEYPAGFPINGTTQEILDWTGMEHVQSQGCYRADPGETYLALDTIEYKCGPAVLQARARPGVLLFLNWPDMGDANAFPPEGVDPSYYPEGVGCFADGGGSCGWGYGQAFITPGQGGPFNVWGSSCTHGGCDPITVGSDMLQGTGWFAGTNHCTFNPWFVEKTKSGTTPPPATGDIYLVVISEDGDVVYHTPMQPGAPAQGSAVYGVMKSDGTVLYNTPAQTGSP